MENGVFIKFFVGGFCGESIVAVNEFNICTLRFELGCEGWLIYSGAPKMHNISGLSRVGHLHLGR